MAAILSEYEPPCSLTISIVLFQQDTQLLIDGINSLGQAVSAALEAHKLSSARLVLVDNNPAPHFSDNLKQWTGSVQAPFSCAEWLAGHGNIGYGRGHNLAILRSDSNYHLILNPDVILAPDTLSLAVDFMQRHLQTGVLAPAVSRPDGSPEYLCKRYPALFDLLLRGFAPCWLQQLFRDRLQHYEMRDLIDDKILWDVPLVSGCFMLCRGPLLRELGGFSQDFFLYFEDYDLSLRIARQARTVYVPSVRIIHYGGQAARKGWRHIGFFIRSAIRFYNRHGWRFW